MFHKVPHHPLHKTLHLLLIRLSVIIHPLHHRPPQQLPRPQTSKHLTLTKYIKCLFNLWWLNLLLWTRSLVEFLPEGDLLSEWVVTGEWMLTLLYLLLQTDYVGCWGIIKSLIILLVNVFPLTVRCLSLKPTIVVDNITIITTILIINFQLLPTLINKVGLTILHHYIDGSRY